MEERKYSEIDILSYVSKKIKEGSLTFKEAVKFKRVFAVQGDPESMIQTILADGTVETEPRKVGIDEQTEQANWIVQNVSGPEKWIVKDSVFKKKYELDPEQEGIFKPKGGPMLAAQVDEDIEFAPPMWGGDKQRINAGGYLLMDPTNPTDVYGIGEEEFNDTYQFTSKTNVFDVNVGLCAITDALFKL